MSNPQKRARQKAGRAARLAEQERALKRRRTINRVVLGAVMVGVIVLVLVLISNGKSKSSSSSSTTTSPSTTTTVSTAQATLNAAAVKHGCPESTSTRVNTLQWKSPPALTIDTSKTYTATVETDEGTFTIALDAAAAPHTVNSFVFLAQHDFFNCVTFHRAIPGFMIQGGDPTGTGDGGPGYQFANENVPKSYPTGAVAMAHSANAENNGSQFFVVVPGGGSQLSPDYSLFGTVSSGMSVVEKINADGDSSDNGQPPTVTHRMYKVTITES